MRPRAQSDAKAKRAGRRRGPVARNQLVVSLDRVVTAIRKNPGPRTIDIGEIAPFIHMGQPKPKTAGSFIVFTKQLLAKLVDIPNLVRELAHHGCSRREVVGILKPGGNYDTPCIVNVPPLPVAAEFCEAFRKGAHVVKLRGDAKCTGSIDKAPTFAVPHGGEAFGEIESVQEPLRNERHTLTID